MDFLKHGRVAEVSELGEIECPCSVRVVGLLLNRAEHSDTVVLSGLSSPAQVLVDVAGCPSTLPRLHQYYEVIGELAPFPGGKIIRARVFREVKTSRMSVDYYEKQLRKCLDELQHN